MARRCSRCSRRRRCSTSLSSSAETCACCAIRRAKTRSYTYTYTRTYIPTYMGNARRSRARYERSDRIERSRRGTVTQCVRSSEASPLSASNHLALRAIHIEIALRPKRAYAFAFHRRRALGGSPPRSSSSSSPHPAADLSWTTCPGPLVRPDLRSHNG